MTVPVVDITHYYNGVFTEKGSKNTWLQTGSGGRVSVLNPMAEEINIEDISNAISKLCRYNGHCNQFYSVAQHCVLGSLIALEHFNSEDLAREFLLHDATEAFVGDLIRPVKVQLPEYEVVENRFWLAIAEKFNLPVSMTSNCKLIDDIMIVWEKQHLLPNSEVWPNLPDITKYDLPPLTCWNWKTSKSIYDKTFKALFK